MADKAIQLSDDQMQVLAQMVADKIKPAEPPAEPPVEPPAPKTENGQPVSAEELVKSLMAEFKNNSSSENKKMFDLMWADKFKQSVNNAPGLEDFINGEDDYGFVRKEKLEAIEDLQERVSALDKLTNSFKQASAGAQGRRPVVNHKAEQKAQETKSKYEELDRKMRDGEYTNVNQLTNDFFKTLSEEVNGLT